MHRVYNVIAEGCAVRNNGSGFYDVTMQFQKIFQFQISNFGLLNKYVFLILFLTLPTLKHNVLQC